MNRGPQAASNAELQREARFLARYGVNLLPLHGKVFTQAGEADPKAVAFARDVVAAMKAEGIYTHLSIYFPLWMTPKPDSFLKGYDGKKHPFAALMFNEELLRKYRSWWKALLTTPSRHTGKPLTEESALFGAEIQNEDSFFFWTFDAKNIPMNSSASSSKSSALGWSVSTVPSNRRSRPGRNGQAAGTRSATGGSHSVPFGASPTRRPRGTRTRLSS